MRKKISTKVQKAILQDEKNDAKKKKIKMLDSIEPKSKIDSRKRAVQNLHVYDNDDDESDDEAVLAIEESDGDNEDDCEEVATIKSKKNQRKRSQSYKNEASKNKRHKLSINEEDIAFDYMEKFQQIYENRFNNSIKTLSQDVSFINKVNLNAFYFCIII